MFGPAILMAVALVSGEVPAATADYFDDRALKQTVTCPRMPRPLQVISPFEVEWFSGMWRAAAERPLSADPRADVGAWRFTTLPTWGHPVIVRIEQRPSGQYIMVAKRLSGQGGYEPGHVDAQIRRPLSRREVRLFREQLDRFSKVWAQPRECSFGADGTVMIFESASAGGYQVAHRWSPQSGPMRSLAEVVIGFTGWGKAAVG